MSREKARRQTSRIISPIFLRETLRLPAAKGHVIHMTLHVGRVFIVLLVLLARAHPRFKQELAFEEDMSC